MRVTVTWNGNCTFESIVDVPEPSQQDRDDYGDDVDGYVSDWVSDNADFEMLTPNKQPTYPVISTRMTSLDYSDIDDVVVLDHNAI